MIKRSYGHSSPGSASGSKTIVGYVHEMAGKINAGKMPDTNFKSELQTDAHTVKKAICFDLTKKPVVKSYMQSESPIKITNVTEKYLPPGSPLCEIVFAQRSLIMTPKNLELDFDKIGNVNETMPIAEVADSFGKLSTEGYLLLSEKERRLQK